MWPKATHGRPGGADKPNNTQHPALPVFAVSASWARMFSSSPHANGVPGKLSTVAA